MQADKQALFGRALCRKKLGDGAGARADVERYRREFPSDPRLRDLEKQVDVSK
jgi:regulator of sirC expression with transglutaminase-like and TPR domain